MMMCCISAILGDSSHRIPIEGLGDANETYHKIYNDLCSFVMVGKKVVPPVFCKVNHLLHGIRHPKSGKFWLDS